MVDLVHFVAEITAGSVAGIVVAALVAGVACFFAGIKKAQKQVEDQEKVVAEIRKKGAEEARQLKEKIELESRAEALARKEAVEREYEEAQREIKKTQARLQKREDNLDRKLDDIAKKEQHVAQIEAQIVEKEKQLTGKMAEVEQLIQNQKSELLRIANINREEAVAMIMKKFEDDVRHDQAQLLNQIVERTREEAHDKARDIILTSIQRTAADHTVDNVVSTIDIPSDDMKGRVIGREGRNIRAFEKATGIDVIVDDTPGVIVVSGFDPIRREVARMAMERLIADGRIHPARIEEVVNACRKEVEKEIREAGKVAAIDADVAGLHPKEVEYLGKLKYRTSYGQNVLQHSVEVAIISGLIASMLNFNVQLAKRCGLLHDIGKAVDHEMEGGHPELGAEIAKRFDEKPVVVNAIGCHHMDGTSAPMSPYAIMVASADAISAARPGARRETFEKYIKRLEKLESVATSYPGVENAYAIQAGREIRVIVDPQKVDDPTAIKTARDIANRIEQEMNYPGQIAVTLIRESRFTEYAK